MPQLVETINVNGISQITKTHSKVAMVNDSEGFWTFIPVFVSILRRHFCLRSCNEKYNQNYATSVHYMPLNKSFVCVKMLFIRKFCI